MTEHILSYINDDGTHNIDFMFVEWPSHETSAEKAGFQAMLVIGLETAECLCRLFDNEKLANKCRISISKVKKHTYEYCSNKQIAAMISLANMADAKYVSDEILKPGGAKGLSTFWGFYTLQALEKSGDLEFALDIIRKFWGTMLDLGATTFWEDFDIDWAENAARIDEPVPVGKKDVHGDYGRFCYTQFRHSLCHGWSSGPTAFLSRFLLGVEAIEPGYKTIRVNPQLAGLEYIKGSVPTPYGNIEIYYDGTKKSIKVPDGITVIDNGGNKNEL